MMRLYLVRHGIAVDRDDPQCPPDAERPLTKKGIEKTEASARGFLALGAKPDAVLTSPLLRAVQTAEIFCEVINFPLSKIVRTDALNGTNAPAELLRQLAKLKANDVLCFGHEPQLHLIICEILHTKTGIPDLKKAGIACLEMEQLAPLKGQLVALYPARTLRLLGDSQ
jgi:phosphohistidine phosphatase